MRLKDKTKCKNRLKTHIVQSVYKLHKKRHTEVSFSLNQMVTSAQPPPPDLILTLITLIIFL